MVPPSRRLFLKGTGLAVSAAWATPALLSFASPAAAASTTAVVDIGPVTNSTHSAVVTKPDRGAFMVLVATSTGPLELTGDGWTPFLATGDPAPQLYAWFGTARGTTDPALTPSDDTGFTAAILSFDGATVASAGESQGDTDKGDTVTAPAFNPRAFGSFVFLGGTSIDRTWLTPPGGYTERLDSRFDPDLYVATLNANATSVRLTTSTLDTGGTARRGVHLSVS